MKEGLAFIAPSFLFGALISMSVLMMSDCATGRTTRDHRAKKAEHCAVCGEYQIKCLVDDWSSTVIIESCMEGEDD